MYMILYGIYIYSIYYDYNTSWAPPVAERPLPIGSEPIWKVTLSSPIELHLYTYLENAAKLLLGSTGASPQVAGAT
jgi:hypothetical protein